MTAATVTGPRQRKYALLLALLCGALAIETAIPPGAERILADVFGTALAIAVWFVVFERPRERSAMAAVLAVAVAISWARYFVAANFFHALSLADQTALLVLLSGAVYVIVRDLFRTPSAGTANVLGAICGYLIAGDAWARVNGIAYLLVPSAYSINPEITALLPDWHGRLALFTYYSFAQILALGYSDVTPVHAPATTLSLFAALFGVFYTAIVVTQFVGLAQRGKQPSLDP